MIGPCKGEKKKAATASAGDQAGSTRPMPYFTFCKETPGIIYRIWARNHGDATRQAERYIGRRTRIYSLTQLEKANIDEFDYICQRIPVRSKFVASRVSPSDSM